MEIHEQNDLFRTTMLAALGKVLMTPGVAHHPHRETLIAQVRAFDVFTEDNDPYGQHDFGSIVIDHETFYWKIDYYDRNYQYGSENPADPAQTARVLTIMLAQEY